MEDGAYSIVLSGKYEDRDQGDFMTCNTSIFDPEMFKSVWRLVVSAIAYAFITFEDDYIIERAITGFRQCATLARHFDQRKRFFATYTVIFHPGARPV